jgi:hypothetical protein
MTDKKNDAQKEMTMIRHAPILSTEEKGHH